MNKKLAVGIVALATLFLLGSGVLAKNFFYNWWNYDGMWEEERFEVIKTFAGCGGAPSYADDDSLFTEEWNKAIQRFKFTVSDIDQMITQCDHGNNQIEIDSAIERISRPKRPLTENEIQKEVSRFLESVRTFDDKNPNGRILTEAERAEHESYLREDLRFACLDLKENKILMRHECEESIDNVKMRFSKAEEYQKKFLNREFSVLKK